MKFNDIKKFSTRKQPPNKNLANIEDKAWHSKMQDHIIKLFESLDIQIEREHRIDFS